jgi:hypothetical protein
MNRAGRQRSARGIDEGYRGMVAFSAAIETHYPDRCRSAARTSGFVSMVLRSSIRELSLAARERDSAAHQGADDSRLAATITMNGYGRTQK